MWKPIVIVFCVFSLTSANLLTFIYKELFTKNRRPDVVATVQERDARNDGSAITHFIGLVEQFEGYKAVEYNITTDDGYILGLHRITASPKSPPSKEKPAILLIHGLLLSSNDFIIVGQKGLTFLLADAGYDVWLGNIRGSMYSRNHIKYTANDPEFWNFRLDEVGAYDITKMVDVALEKSGQKKITYLGYSMGTTLGYILLSGRPEYKNKINFIINLAPVVYFSKPVKILEGTIFDTLLYSAKLLHKQEVAPQSIKLNALTKEFCSEQSSNPCAVFLSPFKTSKATDNTKYPLFLSYFPGSTSYHLLTHYQQIIHNGTLRRYDYPCDLFRRSCKNKLLYKQSEPPIYDLSGIMVPIAIFYAKHDNLLRVKDDKKLRDVLPNVVHFKQVPEDQFNHLDFIWAENAKTLVYDEVLKVLSKFVMGKA